MTRPLPELIQAQIIRLRRRGLTYRAVAWRCKLTKGQVAGVVFRAGLCKPSRNPVSKRHNRA